MIQMPGRKYSRTQVAILLAVLALAPAAAAQNADDYRGGWRTDRGEAHTYEFSIRGPGSGRVLHLLRRATLAFVDGTLGPDGIRFEVTHVTADGSTDYKDTAIANFSQGRLTVTRAARPVAGLRTRADQGSAGTGSDPGDGVRSPEAPPVPANIQRRNPDGADGLPYIQPGPWKSKLTEKDVVGVAGIRRRGAETVLHHPEGRQHAPRHGVRHLRQPIHDGGARRLPDRGGHLKFNILHEDWADGELPTFEKHVTAHVGWNEMRCTTAADHMPPPPPARNPPGSSQDSRCRDPCRSRRPPATSGRMAAEEHLVAPLGKAAPVPRLLPSASARRAPFRIDASW